jgi:hypothetical protein
MVSESVGQSSNLPLPLLLPIASISVARMVFYARVPLRRLIPTVLVRLATDEGEIAFRARWRRTPLELQRVILFKLRRGKALWFEDEWGHDLVFRPERIWGALVDGRTSL